MNVTVRNKKKQSRGIGFNTDTMKSILGAFFLINIAFLFHTVNFMYGDHDWNYVRYANYWNEGAFEGRPLHFVLQSIFFSGQVLPLLNNMVSFSALALSGVLLARYWHITNSTFKNTLFSSFIAVLPYTLVWLFYAKDSLINLSLPLLAISGLTLVDREKTVKKLSYHIMAILLFYFCLASYASVINLLTVCILGEMLISYLDGRNITSLIKQKILPVLDITIALLLFKLTLSLTTVSSEYNTQVIPFDIWPQKLATTCQAMLLQWVVPLPFIDIVYKLCLLMLCLWGMIIAFYHGGIKRILGALILIIACLFCSKLAYFLADERGHILAQMEDFAFVGRLDFYGLAYLYGLGLALIMKFAKGYIYKIGIAFAMIITFMSIVRDMYAQKVWKLGFDAEMKVHERMVARIEQQPQFQAKQKYRLLQIGSLSLRKNYYREQTGEETSLDLLTTSFTPQYMSHIVYNFYYPEDIFYQNASVKDLSSKGKEFLKNQAQVWPQAPSIYIDNDIIIVVLTEKGLAEAKTKLYSN